MVDKEFDPNPWIGGSNPSENYRVGLIFFLRQMPILCLKDTVTFFQTVIYNESLPVDWAKIALIELNSIHQVHTVICMEPLPLKMLFLQAAQDLESEAYGSLQFWDKYIHVNKMDFTLYS